MPVSKRSLEDDACFEFAPKKIKTTADVLYGLKAMAYREL